MSSKKIQIFVFARGGSKGIPNKNIKKFGATTLLGTASKLQRNCTRE